MQYLGGIVLWLLIEAFGYWLGRLLLPLISLGRAYAESYPGSAGTFNWFGYRRDEAGRIEVGVLLTALIGLVAGVIVFSVASFLIRPFA